MQFNKRASASLPRYEVCEMALAHAVGNKAEAAYRRADLFAKSSELMEAWPHIARRLMLTCFDLLRARRSKIRVER